MITLLRSHWFYINLVTLGLVGLLTLWWWQKEVQQTTEQDAQWIPDYYMTNATISQYDKMGSLSSKITAQRFTHIQEFGTTDLLQPRFNIYLADGDSAWFGKADEGLILDSGAQVNLTGNALVTNGPDINRPLSLTSQSLRLFPQQNYAESDQRASLTSKYSDLTGTGMRLTLDTQRLLLLNKVKGSHPTTRN